MPHSHSGGCPCYISRGILAYQLASASFRGGSGVGLSAIRGPTVCLPLRDLVSGLGLALPAICVFSGSWQSALSALFQYGSRKRATDRRERSPDFIETDIIVRGVRPFLGRNQQGMIRRRVDLVGNGDSHSLPFFKHKGFQWPENAILVNCLNCCLHPSILVRRRLGCEMIWRGPAERGGGPTQGRQECLPHRGQAQACPTGRPVSWLRFCAVSHGTP